MQPLMLPAHPTTPPQNARYFCTGETPDDSFWRHFALAVSHYTHFTSPIRCGRRVLPPAVPARAAAAMMPACCVWCVGGVSARLCEYACAALPPHTHPPTSPLPRTRTRSRYPDIIVHRLLAALLDERGSEAERAARHGCAGRRGRACMPPRLPPRLLARRGPALTLPSAVPRPTSLSHRLFPTREVGVIAAHANDRKLAAKSVQDGSLRLYLCVMLHAQPLVCDAGGEGARACVRQGRAGATGARTGKPRARMRRGARKGKLASPAPAPPPPPPPPLPTPRVVVMQLGGSRFLDCYIPALGCDVRIHTDALLRGGGAAVTSTWQADDK